MGLNLTGRCLGVVFCITVRLRQPSVVPNDDEKEAAVSQCRLVTRSLVPRGWSRRCSLLCTQGGGGNSRLADVVVVVLLEALEWVAPLVHRWFILLVTK